MKLWQSFHPLLFSAWFRDARETLDRYQRETVQQEDQVWNAEREKYVKELEGELAELKTKKGIFVEIMIFATLRGLMNLILKLIQYRSEVA